MTAPCRSHGKDNSEWQRMCLSKVRYPDEYVARARIGQLYDQALADKPRLWVYQCPSCRGWHLTSKPRRDGQYNMIPVEPGNLYAERRRYPDDGTQRYAVAVGPHPGDAPMAKGKSSYSSTTKKVSSSQKFTPATAGKSFKHGKAAKK